jgi:hypothetical protein
MNHVHAIEDSFECMRRTTKFYNAIARYIYQHNLNIEDYQMT